MGQSGRIAVIDIGSNSVRLVVYAPPARAPAIIFNEKVTAGLGTGLKERGMLDMAAMATALRALERFAVVTRAMGVDRVRAVATAAVREAENGPDFIRAARDVGIIIETISGEDEARLSGLGVIAAIPEADGIVGDLGGGSLELVRVKGGEVHDRLSLPFGVLRLPALREQGPRALDRVVRKAIRRAGWPLQAKGMPLYLVGGSWRALARLHISLSDYPLPVLHHYAMRPEAAARLVRVMAQIGRKRLRAIETLPGARIPALGDAAALLAILTRTLAPDRLVVSTFGLREGLLYDELDAAERAQDPLIIAAHAAGARSGRFDDHGDVLDRWIAPVFDNDPPPIARLRHAACLLSDVAWAANPEFRAERGLDVALHGNWVGVDAVGRAQIAQALYASFGGNGVPDMVASLLSEDELAQATRWGLAMRLGQRFSGGVAGPLGMATLSVTGGALIMQVKPEGRALYGDAVERRHRQLASALGLHARRE